MISESSSQSEVDSFLQGYQCEFFQNYSYDSSTALGEGCAATVFPCKSLLNDNSGRDIIVKITRSDDEFKIDAALREVNILKHLPEHDNIVKFIDNYHHESRNTVYTVFENAGNMNLEHVVSNPTDQWNDSAKHSVIMQLMKAVEHLH